MRELRKGEAEGETETEGWQSMSLRCWGRRPSGPPADPAGKDMTARETCAGETVMGVIEGSKEVNEGAWRRM